MKNQYPKLFVGPMSRCIVDSCIEFSDENEIPLGLIPSRRQIDKSSGYVNNWNTETFSKYVRDKSASQRIFVQRDHGGPMQGDYSDDGVESLVNDGNHFDLLHIDPFKYHKSIRDSADYTSKVINEISQSSHCEFEIGTEEAIFPMSPDDARSFFLEVRNQTGENFDRVRYLVVQFGTKILGATNTGSFDLERAKRMLDVCKSFNKLSKEHNGDYLSAEDVRLRRSIGLDALNVAPEMGGIESMCVLRKIQSNPDLVDKFFQCCISTNRWQKWFPPNFDPKDDMVGVIRACGHYCFSSPCFAEITKMFDYQSTIINAKEEIKKRIKELL